MARKPLLPPEKTTGKGQQSVRRKPLSPKVKKARAQLCEMLKLIHQVNDKEAGEHYEAGNDAAGDESSRIAAEAKKDGQKWGCGWAA